MICSKLCSFAAAYVTNSDCSSETYSPYVIKLDIANQTMKFDSIGMTHNKTMRTMLKAKTSYKKDTNKLNYNMAFDDCVKIFENNMVLANTFANDTAFRKDAISYAKKISSLSKDCYSQKEMV